MALGKDRRLLHSIDKGLEREDSRSKHPTALGHIKEC